MPLRNPAVTTGFASAVLLLAGCQADPPQDAGGCDQAQSEITVAYQPGTGYGNLRMVEHDGTFEEKLDGVTVEWLELNSGAAIRDGVLSGDIDLASGGVGPFLIGADAGVGWKMLTSLNSANLQLMAEDQDITSLQDLEDEEASVAMPGPDSIQSVVLRKAAQDELGDPRALDAQILAMGHPDGAQALVAGQIGAHLTAPPFQQQIADEGGHVLLDSYDVMGGPHTFNAVYARESLIDCNPDIMPALLESLEDADREISENPESAAEKMQAEIGGGDLDALVEEIQGDDIEFTTIPENVQVFADFMYDVGLIREEITTDDIFFENDTTSEGD